MCTNRLNRLLVLVLVVSFLAFPLSSLAAPGDSELATSAGPKRYLSNIVFAGLAGAVLGLSTLSFYGRPQQRLSNIAVGFAFGIIIGTGYSTYKAAAEPREFYGELKKTEPESWSNLAQDRFSHAERPTLAPQFVFQF